MELASRFWDILDVRLIGLADGSSEEKQMESKMIPTFFT